MAKILVGKKQKIVSYPSGRATEEAAAASTSEWSKINEAKPDVPQFGLCGTPFPLPSVCAVLQTAPVPEDTHTHTYTVSQFKPLLNHPLELLDCVM